MSTNSCSYAACLWTSSCGFVHLYIYIMLYIMSLRYIYYVIYCVTPCSLFITPSSLGWVPLCFSQPGWLQHADSCRLGSKRKTTPGHRFCPCFVKEKKHCNVSTYTVHSILVYIGIEMLKLVICAQKKHVHLKRKSSSCPSDIPKLRDFSGHRPTWPLFKIAAKAPCVAWSSSTPLSWSWQASRLVIKGTSPLWPLSYHMCLLIYIYIYIYIYTYIYIHIYIYNVYIMYL